MEKLNNKAKKDNEIMKVMKVSEISHIIATTNLGTLTLKLIFGGRGSDYRFTLDAVPFDDTKNKELLELFKDFI